MADTAEGATPETDNTDAPAQQDPAPDNVPTDLEKALAALEKERNLRKEEAKKAKAGEAAAKRLSELEDAQKTEAQKAAEAREAAEKRATELEAQVLRYRIATKHRISDEDAETFLTGSDEETLTKQAERLVALQKPGTPRPDPSQGAKQPAKPEVQAGMGRLRHAYENSSTA